ncbi:EAL domain-containing protein [Thiomonas sp.]|uniref:EAL domain-containing protein n=1 Tax=Thiomonas sp. TaxID=2047785 RepID=UPI002634BC06|nr:EAL domain-containing protein [Thiomonas sp.]
MPFREDHVARAYGPQAAEALRAAAPLLSELFARHAVQLGERYLAATSHDAVLSQLTQDERREFEQHDIRHVLGLPDPELNAQKHETAARSIGLEHALVGADTLWRIEVFNALQEAAVQVINEGLDDAALRERATRAISSRIFLDMRYRIASFRRVDDSIFAAVARIDEVAIKTTNLPDLVHGVLATIASIEGDVCGLFGRSDEQGLLQIEASIGRRAELYHESLDGPLAPRKPLWPVEGVAPSPIQRAWSTGDIAIVPSWAADATLGPWRDTGLRIGFRSAVAIPVLDRSGRSIALFNLYSAWPGFFSSRRVRYFLTHAQKILSHGLQQRPQPRVVVLEEQRTYLDLLRRGRVRMLYQPVVDLRDGRVAKFEALARLALDDDTLVAPGAFLPTFGDEELLGLFEQGLRQALDMRAGLDAQGLPMHIGLNFPPEGFVDPRYEQILFATLAASGVDPRWLVLEILEHGTFAVNEARTGAFLARLRDAGILIAQDDLGSGHSSLLRLEQFAFDAVKIDQGLVRGAMAEPQHALEFILHLTRLSHARGLPVTVEGLENQGLVEAATLLGADYGQGYAIARPMPAAEVVPWTLRRAHAAAPAVSTALGAMAGHILWDAEFSAIDRWPQLREAFLALPSPLDGFIEHNHLRGGALDLAQQHHRAIALSGAHTALYRHSRRKVLDLLRQHWRGSL